jgi:hypothetical protein
MSVIRKCTRTENKPTGKTMSLGVFVFVRRTPANNVHKCSCSLKMFAN